MPGPCVLEKHRDVGGQLHQQSQEVDRLRAALLGRALLFGTTHSPSRPSIKSSLDILPTHTHHTHTTHHSLSFSFSHTHTHTQGQGNIYSDDEQTRDQSKFERFCEELTENSEAAITKVLEHVLYLQKNNFYIYKTVRPPSPRFFICLLRIQANMSYIYKTTTSISTKEQLLYLQENNCYICKRTSEREQVS
jgi:hypothetical protein